MTCGKNSTTTLPSTFDWNKNAFLHLGKIIDVRIFSQTKRNVQLNVFNFLKLTSNLFAKSINTKNYTPGLYYPRL